MKRNPVVDLEIVDVYPGDRLVDPYHRPAGDSRTVEKMVFGPSQHPLVGARFVQVEFVETDVPETFSRADRVRVIRAKEIS